MYRLICKIEDPETNKTVHRYARGTQIVEIITNLGDEPTADMIRHADPCPETFEERQLRLAKERAKANESVKKAYRLKPRSR